MVTLKSTRHALAAVSCCMAVACGDGRLVAFENSGLIDDFDDLNSRAEPGFGWWYKVNDGYGSQTLEFKAPSDRPGDKGALHTQGSGFTKWGAIVGVTFDNPIDARRFSAVEFIAENGAAGGSTAMSVWLLDSNSNSFGTQAPLTSSWSRYHITFAGGVSPKDSTLRLDASQLIGVQFSFDNNAGAFDMWVDDVQLVE